MGDRPGILFVLNSLTIGGAEKHVVSLLNALPIEYFRLSLVCIKSGDALLPQLQTERLQMMRSLQVKKGLDRTAVKVLAQLYEEGDVDIVVCTNPYAALYGMLAARRARRSVRLVEVFHTTALFTFKEKLQMPLYRLLFRKFDLLVYVSELQRQYWRNRGLRARSDTTIHNGINVDYFTDTYSDLEKARLRATYKFAATDYVIGICAALRPEKAHGVLLQSLAQLHARGYTAAKLIIIGDGPERAAIEQAIGRLGLRDHAVITGFQSDVRSYIAACDVMALPSYAVETFSIAALESMALGKPMVLSKVGGAAEQVIDGQNGYLVQPNDVAGLTDALVRLSDGERRSRMASEARSGVREKFTIEQMTAAFTSRLRELGSAVQSH